MTSGSGLQDIDSTMNRCVFITICSHLYNSYTYAMSRKIKIFGWNCTLWVLGAEHTKGFQCIDEKSLLVLYMSFISKKIFEVQLYNFSWCIGLHLI